jgi:NADPH:quinone reductase-like Zn-dependent oxidoreductase
MLATEQLSQGIHGAGSVADMRAVVITRHGAPEVLKVEERPDPQAGPGEVRIAVKAAGINFADLMARSGVYPDAPSPPCVVG